MADEPIKTWKKIAIRAIFGGIGFAIGAAAIIGAVIWYSGRPAPAPQWDANALTATFDTIEYSGRAFNHDDAYSLALSYNVKNNTKTTYNLNSPTLKTMALLTDGKAFSNTFDYEQVGDFRLVGPDVIPPDGVGRLTVHVDFYFPSNFSAKDRDDFGKVITPLDGQLKQMGGFVIFDNNNHYRINLPSGWAENPGVKDGTQPYIDPALLKKKTAELPPCPENDPLGLNAKSKCAPLPGK